jgi:hypothetical protein
MSALLLDGTTYDFNGAIDKIKASYRSIGELDPFKKHTQKQWPSTNPFYSAPGGMDPPPIPAMAAIGHRRTSSYDNPPHQQMDNNLGRPSTADGTHAVPGMLSQQQFNDYMDNYIKRQKAQDFRLPAQAPTVTAPAARGPTPWVTCFTCGQKGHCSNECTGTPLPWDDQLKIRERVAMESQEYRARKAAAGSLDGVPPASGVNAVTIGSNPVMQRRLSSTSLEQPRIMGANNIQVVRMGNSQATTAAFAMLHRIPGVMQAVRDAAMALKRDRAEAALDTDDHGKGKQRRLGEGGPPPEATLSGTTVSEEALPEKALPDTTMSEEALPDVALPVEGGPSTVRQAPQDMGTKMPSDAAALEKLIATQVDEAIRRTLTQDDTVIRALPVPTATRPTGKTYAPIKLMRNEAKYDLEAILRDIVPKISLPQLLDISPGLRQELKDLLQSTISRLRKKRVIPLAAFGAPVVTAIAREDQDVSCLYIVSYVNGYRVVLTLVDGGAQIELISEAVVKAIGCKTYSCKDMAMRLANDSIVPLPCYAWLDVNVSGVLARIKAYVMPIEMSFQLLLSRRWLSRVQAIEYHANNVLHIKGIDRVVHMVPGSLVNSKGSIFVASQQTLPREDEEDLAFDDAEAAEQAIDIVLDELDHWEDGGVDQQPSGNVQRLC